MWFQYAPALETAAAAFREVEALFNDTNFIERKGWRIDEENDEGDVVYAKNTPKGKMVTVLVSNYTFWCLNYMAIQLDTMSCHFCGLRRVCATR